MPFVVGEEVVVAQMETGDQAERLAGDHVCSTTVLLPLALREDLERAARAHDRSLGGEVRTTIRRWLQEDGPEQAP